MRPLTYQEMLCEMVRAVEEFEGLTVEEVMSRLENMESEVS